MRNIIKGLGSANIYFIIVSERVPSMIEHKINRHAN